MTSLTVYFCIKTHRLTSDAWHEEPATVTYCYYTRDNPDLEVTLPETGDRKWQVWGGGIETYCSDCPVGATVKMFVVRHRHSGSARCLLLWFCLGLRQGGGQELVGAA